MAIFRVRQAWGLGLVFLFLFFSQLRPDIHPILHPSLEFNLFTVLIHLELPTLFLINNHIFDLELIFHLNYFFIFVVFLLGILFVPFINFCIELSTCVEYFTFRFNAESMQSLLQTFLLFCYWATCSAGVVTALSVWPTQHHTPLSVWGKVKAAQKVLQLPCYTYPMRLFGSHSWSVLNTIWCPFSCSTVLTMSNGWHAPPHWMKTASAINNRLQPEYSSPLFTGRQLIPIMVLCSITLSTSASPSAFSEIQSCLTSRYGDTSCLWNIWSDICFYCHIRLPWWMGFRSRSG